MKNKIPETLEEAILILVANNTSQLEKLRNDDMAKYHHGTGTNIRNAWGLWKKDSPLHKHLHERFGLSHADDLSGIIFYCFHKAINKEPWTYGVKKEVERYRKHWESFGYEIDGETKKELKKCVTKLGDEYCYYHECGPTDPEQCGKDECPHCIVKTTKNGKLQLTNSYLKAKDFGEKE